MDTSTKSVGYKEGSGFTHAYNDEPVTFRPTEAHDGLRDVSCTHFHINYEQTLCDTPFSVSNVFARANETANKLLSCVLRLSLVSI